MDENYFPCIFYFAQSIKILKNMHLKKTKYKRKTRSKSVYIPSAGSHDWIQNATKKCKKKSNKNKRRHSFQNNTRPISAFLRTKKINSIELTFEEEQTQKRQELYHRYKNQIRPKTSNSIKSRKSSRKSLCITHLPVNCMGTFRSIKSFSSVNIQKPSVPHPTPIVVKYNNRCEKYKYMEIKIIISFIENCRQNKTEKTASTKCCYPSFKTPEIAKI